MANAMKTILILSAITLMTGLAPVQAVRSLAQSETSNVIWSDPGDVASLNFTYGVGGSEGQPQPPFQFVNEDFSGTTPKVNVTDGRGTKWNVKWGEEPSPSTFCSRLVWACGYIAEVEYFVPKGRIEGSHATGRAKDFILQDGSFINARFQLRNDSPKYLHGQHWTWTKNPFVGTHELQGLKILLLLVSNWDPKGANLAIFEDDSSGVTRYLYADDDWGAALGKSGNRFSRSKWDCVGFARQTPSFVRIDASGALDWGFEGKNKKEMTAGISVEDVQWLLQFLGKISDEQIRAGLIASGATTVNLDCFVQSLRARIQQLESLPGVSAAR
jgi:hypothetical protein